MIFVVVVVAVACLLCAFNICVILHGWLDLVQNICTTPLKLIPGYPTTKPSAGSVPECRWICMCCGICNGKEEGGAGVQEMHTKYNNNNNNCNICEEILLKLNGF